MLLPALAEHGYKLGLNLEYTPYGADMQLDQLPQIARDITANKIDAVVAFGYPPAAAMKGSSIPTVVAFGAGDPVAARFPQRDFFAAGPQSTGWLYTCFGPCAYMACDRWRSISAASIFGRNPPQSIFPLRSYIRGNDLCSRVCVGVAEAMLRT
jgi:hypothetical protein